MRNIIVPASYMGSGSSAVTDLISEFKNVNNEYGNFEYVFLHCPNGVFDLEDKLLIGNNALRSDEAIHTFLHTMRQLYDKKYWWVGNYKKIIGEEFYSRTIDYINKLSDFRFNDYWYYQENTNFRMFIKLAFNKIIKLITFNKVKLKKPLLYKENVFCYPNNEKFYRITKKYVNDILKMFDSSNNDILLDQLLLPYNLFRIDNYFDNNLKVIVVERDPRDVFLSNKYIWSQKDDTVPFSRDVKEFCKQYKMIRVMEKKSNSSKILRIKFEDLIYKYDETKNIIMKFLGYTEKDHLLPKSKFNPDVSIKNTQLFKNEKYKKEARYIEKELFEYLYEFPLQY